MKVSEPSSTVILGPPTCTRNCWALNTSSSWIVNLPAYFPSWTMSVTTWTFLGVAFWPRVPVLLHSLRSPVSKSALKMILPEAEPVIQHMPIDTIIDSAYLSVIWIPPWETVPAPSVPQRRMKRHPGRWRRSSTHRNENLFSLDRTAPLLARLRIGDSTQGRHSEPRR